MSEVDSTAKAALEQARLKYRIEDNGDFRLLMMLGEGRSQKLLVGSTRHKVGNKELRSVFSLVHVGDMPEPAVMAYCLEENGRIAYGSWRLQVDNENQQAALVFGGNLDADADAEELLLMIQTVAMHGDGLEKKLSEKDEF